VLNAFEQFRVPINGIDVHYIHQRGQGPAPMPLLLSHGWPGSASPHFVQQGPLRATALQ